MQTKTCAACLTPSTNFVVTGAHNDPTLAFFKLAGKRSPAKQRSAKGTLQLAAPPISLQCHPLAASEASAQRCLLLAITVSGAAEVWQCTESHKHMASARLCTIAVDSTAGSDAQVAQGIFAACFEGSKGALAELHRLDAPFPHPLCCRPKAWRKIPVQHAGEGMPDMMLVASDAVSHQPLCACQMARASTLVSVLLPSVHGIQSMPVSLSSRCHAAIRVARGVPEHPTTESVVLPTEAGAQLMLQPVKPALLVHASQDVEMRPPSRAMASALGQENSGHAVQQRCAAVSRCCATLLPFNCMASMRCAQRRLASRLACSTAALAFGSSSCSADLVLWPATHAPLLAADHENSASWRHTRAGALQMQQLSRRQQGKA